MEKGKFEGLIIDRSKSQRGIDSQIDVSAMKFQKMEIQKQFQKEGINSLSGTVMFFRMVEIWIVAILKRWGGMERKRADDPKGREWEIRTPRSCIRLEWGIPTGK